MTPVRVIAAGLMWRLFGTRWSAETLLDAMSGENEQNRMLAGISLVRAGNRSFDLVEEKIARGEVTESALRLLPDIDEGRARKLLDSVVASEGELSGTARECLDTLDRIEAFHDSQG